jgi:hypothetical protein
MISEDQTGRIALTVYFEDPFWVGLVEREERGELGVARHVFGGEPLPGEVLEFVLRTLPLLLERGGATLAVERRAPRAPNPKRAAREAARELAGRGPSTRSQEALRLQIEQGKQDRRQRQHLAREAEQERRRTLAVQKAKEKRRGH